MESLSVRLLVLDVGESIWTEHDDKRVTADVARVVHRQHPERRFSTQRFAAVDSVSLSAYRVVRVVRLPDSEVIA